MLQYFKLFLQIAFAVFIPFIILEELQTTFFPGQLELETALVGGVMGTLLSLMVADRFMDRRFARQNAK